MEGTSVVSGKTNPKWIIFHQTKKMRPWPRDLKWPPPLQLTGWAGMIPKVMCRILHAHHPSGWEPCHESSAAQVSCCYYPGPGSNKNPRENLPRNTSCAAVTEGARHHPHPRKGSKAQGCNKWHNFLKLLTDSCQLLFTQEAMKRAPTTKQRHRVPSMSKMRL